ncbi:MAG: single-stranded DNA-binding protein [Erysipelotrichaceae bacterium]|nr:single-stranded DNA-binding protein [Erysipelotrichaceae bacterium]
MLNQVVLVGKVVQEPVVKEFGNNNQLAVLVIEVKRTLTNNEEVNDQFQVIMWKNTMQTYLQECKIDNIIGIKGRLQANNFVTKEKNMFYSCDIITERISLLKLD